MVIVSEWSRVWSSLTNRPAMLHAQEPINSGSLTQLLLAESSPPQCKITLPALFISSMLSTVSVALSIGGKALSSTALIRTRTRSFFQNLMPTGTTGGLTTNTSSSGTVTGSLVMSMIGIPGTTFAVSSHLRDSRMQPRGPEK